MIEIQNSSKASDLTVFVCIQEILAQHNFSNEQVLGRICELEPELSQWLQASAQVYENYSIYEHVARVLDQFQTQCQHYDLSFIEKYLNLDSSQLKSWFKAILILHDIGKAFGNKKHQHKLTLPILRMKLENWRYSEKCIRLAQAIVGHDHLGSCLKHRTSSSNCVDALGRLAEGLNISLPEFYKIQWLFYVCDASSYPSLRTRLFCVNKLGKLDFPDPLLEEIRDLIFGTAAKQSI